MLNSYLMYWKNISIESVILCKNNSFRIIQDLVKKLYFEKYQYHSSAKSKEL